MHLHYITDEAVYQWKTGAAEYWHNYCKRELAHYQRLRHDVAKQDLSCLDQAIAARYLFMPWSQSKRLGALQVAFESWCVASGWPLLTIERTARKHIVNIEFDLKTMAPGAAFNLYQPVLDGSDEQYRLLMLLASEHSRSYSGYVYLHQVKTVNADEVARQLLAWFDRCAEARRREIEALLKESA